MLPIKIEDHILQQCIVAVKDANKLTPEEFTISRRNGIGASEASILLGYQSKWSSEQDVIESKLLGNTISDKERKIGQKVAVRQGRDLEPLILDKASKILGVEIFKPTDTYALHGMRCVTINFDGVAEFRDAIIPIEAKYVTKFGEKYYDTAMGYTTELPASFAPLARCDMDTRAESYGIPNYYYAQVQQQMLGLDSPFGFLAALHEVDWTLRLYYVPADPEMHKEILLRSFKTWQKILQRKRAI